MTLATLAYILIRAQTVHEGPSREHASLTLTGSRDPFCNNQLVSYVRPGVQSEASTRSLPAHRAPSRYKFTSREHASLSFATKIERSICYTLAPGCRHLPSPTDPADVHPGAHHQPRGILHSYLWVERPISTLF